MSRHKSKRNQGEVELNLAAMLDMAFQLLTFFILTFRPAPIEGQVLLNLPQAMAPSGPHGTPGPDPSPAPALDSLVVTLMGDATGSGKVARMAVGEQNIDNLRQMEQKLQNIVGDKNSTFEQVIIQADSNLRYEEVMKIVELCTKLRKADGRPLPGLSFVERPIGS